MYFKVNIILIISSYQSINVLASDYVSGIPGRYNCYVRMPQVDVGYSPVPFQGNVTRPEILQPDGEGNYLFTHNTLIKLACPGSHFTTPLVFAVEEISVLCLNGFLLYRNTPMLFHVFKCKKAPRASLKITRIMCQNNENHSVLDVGFQARNFFLKSYRICFDLITKRNLYSWYYVNSPIINVKQFQLQEPRFTESRLMDEINLTLIYKYGNQKKAVESNFDRNGSKINMPTKNIYSRAFLVPGQLLSEDEFTYVSEQYSTYYYENTAPMWSKFHNDAWRLLQKLFKRNLIRGTTRHMIAAGTYGLDQITDIDGMRYPMNIATYNRVPVPEYVWKMDYDIDRRSGTVFIGYNHPVREYNKSKIFCDTVPCPGFLSRDSTQYLLFCCTKESFEEHFGLFDSYLYRPF